jgi:hypothetical protein
VLYSFTTSALPAPAIKVIVMNVLPSKLRCSSKPLLFASVAVCQVILAVFAFNFCTWKLRRVTGQANPDDPRMYSVV